MSLSPGHRLSIYALFELPSSVVRCGYTVSRDGRRFLVVANAGDAAVQESLEVVVDWLAASKH